MVLPRQLSDRTPDGTLLGYASTDKLGFYGLATPIVKPVNAGLATVTKTTTTTATTTALQTDLDAVRVQSNALVAVILALGLGAAS